MKKWYMSRTLWINIGAIVIIVCEYLLTQKIYSPEIHALVIAIVNIGLRMVTNQGVTK